MITAPKKHARFNVKNIKQHSTFYILLLPAVVLIFIFAYIPLFGLIVAFKDYDIWKGFWGSPWAANHGLANIIKVMTNRDLLNSIGKTVMLSCLNLLICFPAQIILALLFNELALGPFKKVTQTISYMPYFISWISVIGLCHVIFSDYGAVNDILSAIFPQRERVLYLSKQEFFVPLLVGLNLWKTVGWGSIIYLSAITSIDPQLYEAAAVDGAGRWRQTLSITLPGLSTTAIIMFILSIGSIFGSNFELVFGLQNAFIDFETIDTVIYKGGLLQRGYGVATAMGFIRGLLALGLTLGANYMSKKYNDVSVF